MFDPTVYENFKVIIEGSVYDADFSGKIKVIDRSETIDLSILSRRYEIAFTLANVEGAIASLVIASSLKELADEILYENDHNPGAYIEVHFAVDAKKTPTDTHIQIITDCLSNIWGSDRNIHTTVSQYFPNGDPGHYSIKSIVSFKRIIIESQAEDLYKLVEYVITSLQELNKL
jgi:hypothetical protein